MDQRKIEGEQISLKEFILLIKRYYRSLVKHWLYILIAVVFLGSVFAIYAKMEGVKYKAELTFMLNEDGGSSLNSLTSGLLGRFVGGGGKYNLEKILNLSRSRHIIEKALFRKGVVNHKEDFLANHFINFYSLNMKTKEDSLDGFFFTSDTIITIKESRMMNKLYELIAGEKGLFSASTNEKSGIMTMELLCKSEDLAVCFINTTFTILSDYYINKSIEKETISYNLLKEKADYLKGRMNQQLDQSLIYQDKTLGSWQGTSTLPYLKHSRDTRISTEMYGEILKNLEIADFTLKTKTPFIQKIDSPRKPLEAVKSSMIKYCIVGGFLGFFLSFLYLLIRKVISDAMKVQEVKTQMIK